MNVYKPQAAAVPVAYVRGRLVAAGRLPTQDELPYDDGIPMDSDRHVNQMLLLIGNDL